MESRAVRFMRSSITSLLFFGADVSDITEDIVVSAERSVSLVMTVVPAERTVSLVITVVSAPILTVSDNELPKRPLKRKVRINNHIHVNNSPDDQPLGKMLYFTFVL